MSTTTYADREFKVYQSLLKDKTDPNSFDRQFSYLPESMRRRLLIEFRDKQKDFDSNFNLSTAGTILEIDVDNVDEFPPHTRVQNYEDEDHTFQINDILFTINPQMIQISHEVNTQKDWVMRTNGMSKAKSSRGAIFINVTLPFVGVDEINLKLRRLIAQVRTIPICYIDNELIRQVVSPDSETINMAVVVTNMNVNTHPDATDTLLCTLSMEVFNYFPFSDNFYYAGGSSFGNILADITNTTNVNKTKGQAQFTEGQPDFEERLKQLTVQYPQQSILFTNYYDFILGDTDIGVINAPNDNILASREIPKQTNITLSSNDRKYNFKKVGSELNGQISLGYYVYYSLPFKDVKPGTLSPSKKEPTPSIINAPQGLPQSGGSANSIITSGSLVNSPNKLGTPTSINQKGSTGLNGNLTGKTMYASEILGKGVAITRNWDYASSTKYGYKKRYDSAWADCSALVYRILDHPSIGIGYIGYSSEDQRACLDAMDSQGVTAYLDIDGTGKRRVPIPLSLNKVPGMANSEEVKLYRLLPNLIGLRWNKAKKDYGHSDFTIGVQGKYHSSPNIYKNKFALYGAFGGGYGDNGRGVGFIWNRSVISTKYFAQHRLYFIPNAIYVYNKDFKEIWDLLIQNNPRFKYLREIIDEGKSIEGVRTGYDGLNGALVARKGGSFGYNKEVPGDPSFWQIKKPSWLPTTDRGEYTALDNGGYTAASGNAIHAGSGSITFDPGNQSTQGTQLQKDLFSERIVEAAKEARAALTGWAKQLDEFQKREGANGWALDYLRNGTAVFKKLITFNLTNPIYNSPSLIPINISANVSNIFARIPLLSHHLATHQYFGSGDLEANITFYTTSNELIASLEYIHRFNEMASNVLRRLPDVGTVIINNEILNLMGSENFLIDRLEISTVEQAPGLYQVNLKLTEWRKKQHLSQKLNAEFTGDANIKKKVLEEIVKIYHSRTKRIKFDGTSNGMNMEIQLENKKDFATVSDVINANERQKLTQKSKLNHVDFLILGIGSAVLDFLKPVVDTTIFYQLGINESEFDKFSENKTHPYYNFGILKGLTNFDIGTLFGGNRKQAGVFTTNYQQGNQPWRTPAVESFIAGLKNNRTYELLGLSAGISTQLEKNGGDIGTFNKLTNLQSKITKLYSPDHEVLKYDSSSYLGYTVTDQSLKALTNFLSANPLGSSNELQRSTIDRFAEDIASGVSPFLGAYRFVVDMYKYPINKVINMFKEIESKEAGKYLESLRGQNANAIVKSYPDLFYEVLDHTQSSSLSTILSIGTTKVSLKEFIKYEQYKLGVALAVAIKKFNNVIVALLDTLMPQLMLDPRFNNIFNSATKDNLDYSGLPAYQDIPLPKVQVFNPSDNSKINNTNQNQTSASPIGKTYQYLNPDFYWINLDDAHAVSTKRILKYASYAEHFFGASEEFSRQFGMLPSKEPGTKGQPHILAQLGGYLGPHAKALGQNENFDRTQLPDTLFFQNFPTQLSQIRKDGKTHSGIQLSKPDNSIAANSETNLNLNRVVFGPVGLTEFQLPVLLDRNPSNIIQGFSKAIIGTKRNVFKMRRAFPAFKLYFIEDDTSGILGGDTKSYVRSHDDFFSFSAIKEIKFVRSRKIPSDLLIIRLSNLFGFLDDAQFSFSNGKEPSLTDLFTDQTGRETSNYLFLDTKDENPFVRFILKEGIRVQLRLGYENDPTLLDTEFNGQIVQVNTVSANEIVIVCQSFATQLVAYKKGSNPKDVKSEWVDTFDLLSWAMCQPEVTYFGRWQENLNLSTNPVLGESRSTGGWEKIFSFLADPRDDNIFAPSRAEMIMFRSDNKGGIWSFLLDKTTRNLSEWLKGDQGSFVSFQKQFGDIRLYNITLGSNLIKFDLATNSVVTGNSASNQITSMPLIVEQTVDAKGQKGDIKTHYTTYGRGHSALLDYHVYRTTIWDIFKEMELRHPGWISHPVPYGNRMTMFFGQPNQLYWSRPPTNEERLSMSRIQNELSRKILEKGELRQALFDMEKYSSKKIFSNLSYFRGLFDAFGSNAKETFVYGASLALLGTGLIIAGIATGGLGFLAGGAGALGAGGITGAIGTGLVGAGGLAAVTGGAAATGALASIQYEKLSNLNLHVKGKLEVTQAQAIYQSSILALAQQSVYEKLIQTKIMGRLIPFRRYHLVTSDHHIVSNNIKTSVNNVYNAVTVEYSDADDSAKIDGETDVGRIPSGKVKTKTMKASDRILDKDVRMGFFSFPYCRGSWMAGRYCQGLLMRYMKDTYQGELVILGDQTIRPYDRVLIMDTYTGMFGPVDVEQAVHTLSPETGFLTEITPDLVVYGNNIVDMPYDDYTAARFAWESISWRESVESLVRFENSVVQQKVQQGIEQSKKTSLEGNAANRSFFAGGAALAGLATGAAIALGGGLATIATAGTVAVGAAIAGYKWNFDLGLLNNLMPFYGSMGIKFYEWTTERNPLIFQPLFLAGRPLIAGVDMDKVNIAQHIKDRFLPILRRTNDGFDVYHQAANSVLLSRVSAIASTIAPFSEAGTNTSPKSNN